MKLLCQIRGRSRKRVARKAEFGCRARTRGVGEFAEAGRCRTYHMDDFAADLPPEVSDRCADSDAGYDLRIDSTQLTVVECADILRASLPQGWRLPDRR